MNRERIQARRLPHPLGGQVQQAERKSPLPQGLVLAAPAATTAAGTTTRPLVVCGCEKMKRKQRRFTWLSLSARILCLTYAAVHGGLLVHLPLPCPGIYFQVSSCTELRPENTGRKNLEVHHQFCDPPNSGLPGSFQSPQVAAPWGLPGALLPSGGRQGAGCSLISPSAGTQLGPLGSPAWFVRWVFT